MRFWHLLGFALCLLIVPVAAERAYGQADPALEQAKALFVKGKAEMDAGRPAEALKLFQESYATKPVGPMLKNIAVAFETLGDLPAAVDYYTRYVETNPKDAEKIAETVSVLRKTLATSWSTIELTTEPSGANVWLGSKAGPPRGTTPVTLQVPSGKQIVVLEKPGFQLVTRPITLAAGRSTPMGIALPALMPVLVVRTSPVGAEVVIDGRQVGKTPFNQAVSGGAHKLELRMAGHATQTKDIELTAAHTASAPLTIDATLGEQAATGLLALDVDRKGSHIIVDGTEIGTTPLPAPVALPEGLHKLEVRPEGDGKTHEEMVAINAGQMTVTKITLGLAEKVEPSGPGMSGRTWSYIIMGTGGAIVATGGVFGLLANSASGDLDSCRKSDTCKRTQSEVKKADAVRSKALLTDIFLGTGIAAAGAGLAVFFMSDSPSDKPTVTVVPTLGGAAAVGSFEF